MIQKAKGGVNRNGIGALMWGTVVALAGILSYIKAEFDISYGWFDPWLLCLLALIPQIFIVRKERLQKRLAKRHDDDVINAVWSVYGISIFMLVFYFNLVPAATEGLMAQRNLAVLLKDTATGQIIDTAFYTVYSHISLLLILFAVPTLITGIGHQNKPMLIGGILNIVLFFVTLYTNAKYDNLIAAVVAIGNWLVPGIIMRKQYLQAKHAPANV
ncbi:MAG: hypothetical protein EAY72_07085 [Bacteroidetes bacterium]|nr:MAG: hypothetical protein EAY72_07085 [Bacteroidota bacterium]TAE72768.1 MAG: hypothetical protein EAY68_00380 [Bacteroidota bacterium]